MGGGVLEHSPGRLALAASVDVDVHHLLEGRYQPEAQMPPRRQLCGELLPGWYDDWISLERERFRKQRLEALEALAARLLIEKQYGASLEIALACIGAEPLREKPHLIVAEVHLGERNYSEAVRHLESYSRLLRREIASEPSPRIARMLRYSRIPRPLGN